MKLVVILTRTSSNKPSKAFHQPIYHIGDVSIASALPLIRQVYLGIVGIPDSEVYVLHSKEEKELVKYYLPELSQDNLVQIEESYELSDQINKVIQLCDRLGDSYLPFSIVPLDHVAFNSMDYFKSIHISLEIAQRFGKPTVLGNISKVRNVTQGFFRSKHEFISASGISACDVSEYNPPAETMPIEISDPEISQDCGIISWRARPAYNYLSQLRDCKKMNDSFAMVFNYASLREMYVVRGEFGWLNEYDDPLELIPYGKPDRNGNVLIGDFKPFGWTENRVSTLIPYDDNQLIVQSNASSIIVTSTEVNIEMIKEDLDKLSDWGGFTELIEMIKKRFGI